MNETTTDLSLEPGATVQKNLLDLWKNAKRASRKICPLTYRICTNPAELCDECSIVRTKTASTTLARLDVCVIGIGTVGFSTALHIKKHHGVHCYDIDPDKIKKGQRHFLSTAEWERIPYTDIYVVCVNTWWNSKPDMSAVYDVCARVKERGDAKLVCIESTVNVGTCRKVWREIFNKKVAVACCPHRLWPNNPGKYGVRQLRVLGELKSSSEYSSVGFYRSINIPFKLVDPIEVAELAKIAENSYYFMQIAFAEELSMLCEELGLDFISVRDAINTHFRFSHSEAQLREARDGIGGTCLPKDIRFLNSVSKTPKQLIAAAILADELYKEKLK